MAQGPVPACIFPGNGHEGPRLIPARIRSDRSQPFRKAMRGGEPSPVRIPCAGARNPLKDQYESWWTSVLLETITSECANIPAFSYLGSSGLHRFIPPKAARPSRGTIPHDPPDWKKSSLINGLICALKRILLFASRLAPAEGRSCGPASWSRDRQFFRSGPDRVPAVRKTLGLIAEFRLPPESSGVDGPLNGPDNLESTRSVTGDSRPFPAIRGNIRLSDTLRPIRMDQRIRRKAARAI